MSYDQTSFLQGIAVGKSLKGWSSGLGTAVPTCWNDEGRYTYMFIDYHLPITAISLSLFRLCTRIMCENGEIDVTAVESYNSTTFKVYCDLTKANKGWVAAMGYNSSWLEYDSGVKVPEYASIFWIDSKQPWTPGYLEDASALNRVARDGTEGLTITHRVGTRYEAEEHMTVVVPALNPSETLNVRYS